MENYLLFGMSYYVYLVHGIEAATILLATCMFIVLHLTKLFLVSGDDEST